MAVCLDCGIEHQGEAMEGEVTQVPLEKHVDYSIGFSTCHVTVPDEYGIVVEFAQVHIQEQDRLIIYSPGTDSGTVLRNFNSSSQDSLAPLFRNESRLTLFFYPGPANMFFPSNVSIRYTAYNKTDIPGYSQSDHSQDVDSTVVYHCEGITNLPPAITCDGIRHCQDGEDEEGCAYRHEGCGDWVPYHDNCLKAFFPLKPATFSGSSFVTMPFQALAACQAAHGATLASLSRPGEVEFVADMVRKSGFRSAAVNLRKVKPVFRLLRHLYRFVWQWGDEGSPIAYEQHWLQGTGATADCAVLNVITLQFFEPTHCVFSETPPHGYVCMKPNPTRETQRFSLSGLSFPRPSKTPDEFPTKECPDGSVVQTFHSCQWGAESEDEAGPGLSLSNLPLFQCRFGPAVHYTHVCDGHDDCMDGSDETKCHRPQFAPIIDSSFICTNFQRIAANRSCDGMHDCFDESDEEWCSSCQLEVVCPGLGCIPLEYSDFLDACNDQTNYVPRSWPEKHVLAAVDMNGYGLAELNDANGSCADTFYHCQGGHCIPTFLLNNGEQDCPQGEDEGLPVTNITCPGYYRCRGDGRCVHWDYLCDGIYHCANKDDEFFCHMTCPRGCQCEGHAYTCSKMVDPLENLYVRYLDLSNASVVSLDGIHYMEYLFFLNLTSCGLPNITLANMPQLLILDLSFNNLTDLASMNLSHLPRLEQLSLSNNLLVQTIGGSFTNTLHSGKLENLKILRMTNVGLKTMEDTALRPLASLSYLDISQNPLRTYGAGALSGLTALEELHTDEFKLCCRHFHSTLRRCLAPVDELSSCSDLLAQDFFRVCLWGVSGLSIVGNIGVLVYRQLMSTKNSPSAAGVLIKNLCASDLLMGVYMMIIGTADAQLRGDYVTKDTDWKTSPVCTVAGFLCFLSSEVSALVVCLITLDRVLVIGFPFHSQLHLSHGVSVALCCVVWATGAALAAVPLLADLQFYGQNGICILLPITRQDFLGQHYAFGVFFVLNFIFFIVIGLGQLFIFTVIRRSSVAAGTQKQQRDLAIARRLFTVALTDFCCWFPIGLMGLLAARGVPIPGIVNVWAAIFVLPLNSALNPFLYTLNGLLHQWRKKRMEKTTRKMRGNVTTEVLAWQPDSVHNLVKMCVQSRKIDKEVLVKLLGGTAVSTTATAGIEESSHSSDDRRGQ